MNESSLFYNKNLYKRIIEVPPSNVLIHTEYPYRSYMTFYSWKEFLSWYSFLPSEKRMCHEVILSTKLQKFRVDLDELDSSESIVNTILPVIKRIFKTIFSINNIEYVIYDNKKDKKSYHIVITNVMFEDNKLPKLIGSILSNNSFLKSDIDCQVYKSIQNFRIEKSIKKSNYQSVKTCLQSSFNKSSHEYVCIEGLVTNSKGVEHYIKNSSYLPFIKNKEDLSSNKIGNNSNKSSTFLYDNSAFTLRDLSQQQSSSIIYLNRKHPSYCNLCKRTHDKENAYVYNGNFYCWRYNNNNKNNTSSFSFI